MGSFYSNVVAFGVDTNAVVPVCQRPAFLGQGDGFVVVFAEGDDDADPEEAGLSSVLACTTMTVTVHDSDLLVVFVHTSGALVLQGCVPDPGEYFSGEADGPGIPAGQELVAAVGRGDAELVDACLVDDGLDAEERHEALLAALDLPTWSARFGYRYLAGDDSGYAGPNLLHVE